MDQSRLKIVFMGTPDFSVPALENLIANSRFQVIAVYTQPPRPAGRGQQVRLSPVHQVAEAHKIPVFTPHSLKKDKDAVLHFSSLQADVAVVAAYGLILPRAVLDAPRYGCLNIHASLLPRWRGAAPIQRAIEAGDAESGITIMQMDEGLDTGAMLFKKAVAIRSQTTAQSLHDELSALGSSMIEDILEMILDKIPLSPEIQDDSLSCYAPMLSKDEGRIDWGTSASSVDRKVRAFTPWPGCWSVDDSDTRFKILEGEMSGSGSSLSAGTLISAEGDVVCGDGRCYRITKIQPESAKPMRVVDALNGGRLKTGQTLS